MEEEIFKFHNYDGEKIHDELIGIAVEDSILGNRKLLMAFPVAVTAFSGYNLTRFGALTN